MTKYDILKKYFGYDTFRKGQELMIDSILNGRDVLGIMPTGAGKSMCYQIPALMFPGITLVISPLISLMKDQVASLNQAGIHAAYLNSSLTPGQYSKALSNMASGMYKIVYIAPERLSSRGFLDALKGLTVSMVSVDEAHCISQWGQDFRPSYLNIAEFIGNFERRPVVSAFTATATKEVREDIVRLLLLSNPVIQTTGFDRTNLRFEVESPKDKTKALLDYVQRRRMDCGIVYCITRKLVEDVCMQLVRAGYEATRYHAGLSDEERKNNQDDFIYDRKKIMVATNAFGMGIDKSNVRYVVHYNMPKNIESYYQEAGRAGRDGLDSECILYYSGQDVVMNQFLIDQMQGNEDIDEQTLGMLRQRERERLKKMTFYALTSECLREYMLRYFGERSPEYCGNCSNCLNEFEEKDVTRTASCIVGCIAQSVRAYGITMIADTVRGSKNAKIIRSGMEENPYYGSCSKATVQELRQVLNFLILENYVELTDGEYPVLRLTKRSEDLMKGQPVWMKVPKAKPKVKAEAVAGKVGSGMQTEIDNNLFQKLRRLRLEIAREENIPPYIVFTDKTLVNMCVMRPKNREEMLQVSGVGEMKYRKYGKVFLDALN